MKQTLLDIVQAILAAMDSEEINSIADTVEAKQVALICKNVYYDITTDLNLPGKQTIFQLNASGDITVPCVMTVPADIFKVENVRYDYTAVPGETPDYRIIELLTFEDFMLRQIPGEAVDNSIQVQTVTVGGEDFQFYYRNNADPKFYTTFNDNTLIFDSYNSVKEDTLQKVNTMCTGRTIQTFLLEDSFIPDLEANQFSYYINKCKVRAFNELKQTANQEAAAETRRQKIMQQKRKGKTEDLPAVFTIPARFGKSGTTRSSDKIPRSLRSGS